MTVRHGGTLPASRQRKCSSASHTSHLGKREAPATKQHNPQTMTYRFSLGKILDRCPQCGRRTFKPYMDNATGLPLDAAACGRCNREVKCRYHMTPAQWFAAVYSSITANPQAIRFQTVLPTSRTISAGADRQTKKTAPGRGGPGLSDYSFWKPYVGDMRVSIGEETRGDFALRGVEVRRSGFVGVRNGRVKN